MMGIQLVVKSMIFCAIILSLISGCNPTPPISQPVSQTELPTFTEPVVPIHTLVELTPAPTVTETPSPSLTPTDISTPIPTSTFTVTPTPIPTLGEAESNRLIREYMRTNANCVLPCFWGLVPGESKWGIVRNIMAYLRLQVRRPLVGTPGDYSIAFDLGEGPVIHGSVGFLEQSDIVQVIRFGANDITQAPSYDLANVMKDLGMPAYVGIDLRIGLSEGPPKTPSTSEVSSYGIIVAYGDKMGKPWPENPWAIFSYSGGAFKIGDHYRFCPTNLLLKGLVAEKATNWLPKGFRLALQSSESSMNVEELGGMPELPDIESATGISLQEFYRRIVEGEEPACFDTPIKFWQ
jgi:hypothetical protein